MSKTKPVIENSQIAQFSNCTACLGHNQCSQMLKIDALNWKSNAILIYFFGGQKKYSQIA